MIVARKNLQSTIILCLVLSLALAITGCTSKAPNATKEQSNQPQTSQQPAPAAPSPKPADNKILSIATASMGGSFYPIGVGISEVINKNIKGVQAQVEITGGAVENPSLVQRGQSDLGITNGDIAYAAYNGTEMFKDNKCADLRLLFAGLQASGFHTVVGANSGINSYKDLKGKRVAVGPPGGRPAALFPLMLEFYGLTMNDIKPTYLAFDEGVRSVVDGNLDAAIVQAPPPAPSITELASVGRFAFKLLPFEPDVRSKFIEKYPFMVPLDFPVGMYANKEPIPTLGVPNVVVVSAKMSEDLGYSIVKAVFENIETIRQSHPSAKVLKVENAVADYLPMHPGAVKYYKEKGVLK